MPLFVLLSVFLSLLYAPFILADSLSSGIPRTQTTIEPMTITSTEYDQLPSAEQQRLASQWHLTVTDYSHYLWLMKYTANGWYYQNQHLDPSWVLGFNATTDQEREKYARIAIQNERAKIEKELAFQRTFIELQKVLFPNQLPIENHATSFPAITHSGSQIMSIGRH